MATPLSWLFSAGGGFSFPLHCPEPPGGRHQRGEATEPPDRSPPQARRRSRTESRGNGGRRAARRAGGAERERHGRARGRRAAERDRTGLHFQRGSGGLLRSNKIFRFSAIGRKARATEPIRGGGAETTHQIACRPTMPTRKPSMRAQGGRLRPPKRGNGRGI